MRLKLLVVVWLLTCGLGFGQIAFYNFQDIPSAAGVNPNITASDVTLSAGTIAYQIGTDDGGTRIGNSGTWNTGNFNTTGKYLQFSITPNTGFEIDLTEIRLRFGRTSAGPTRVTVQYSLDGFATAGTTILNDATVSSENAAALNSFSITTGLPSNISGTVTIRIWGHNASGTGNLRFNNFRVFGNVNSVTSPTITVTPASITNLDYIVDNGPSAEQTFTVSGTNLTNNITLTAPANFEISTTSGGTFGSNLTLTQSGGNVANTTIYTRLADGLANGNYTGNINATSTGATAQNVAVSGTVNNVSIACGFESFTNSNAPSGGSYSNGNFTGDNGITWTYFESRDENGDANGSGIDGAALMLRRVADNSRVVSGNIPGGIQNFSVKLYKGFSGSGNRQVELLVNGVSRGTSSPFDNFDEQIFTVNNINVSGDITIEIRNITSNQVIIDDISWTCFCTEASAPTGVISGDTASCGDTNLSYSLPSATTFWQTRPDGTSLQYPTTTDFEVTETGTYYVRTFDGSCWSIDTVSFDVIINSNPEITSQPSNQLVIPGNNVTFQISAINASGFQWQESTDGGVTWSNIGTNSNSLTLNSVPLSSHENRYRIIVSSASCDSIISNIVTLFVVDGSDVCIDEDFTTFPSGWTNNVSGTSSEPVHYGIASPARSLGENSSIITTSVDYPKFLQFYQDASNNGNGQIATIDYRIGAGAWTSLYGFEVTTAGKTEVVDLSNINGVNLTTQANVTFRFNSSFNTWYLDDVKVFCDPCTPAATPSVANITSGPVGTWVTINGVDFTPSTTVSFSNINANIITQTATQLVVEVPTGTSSGNILIFTPFICAEVIPFEVITQEIDCQTNFTANDLIIYEIFDEDSSSGFGNGGMVTLFNATLSPINLSNYRIFRSATFGVQDFNVWFSPSGILNPGEIYRVKINSSTCTNYAEPSQGVVIGFNADDGFELRKLNALGVYETIDQVVTPDYVGYYFERNLTMPMPSAAYNVADWTLTNIVNECAPGIVGTAPDFIGGLPEITSVSTDVNTCNEAIITVNALEGYNETSPTADARQLNFQWFYFDGISGNWTEISPGGDFNIIPTINDSAGTGVSTLEIANTSNKENYQYYCRIREDDNSCFVATEAIRIITAQTTWNGTTWNPSPPTANTLAIIEGDYLTETQGSFSACNLIINSGQVNIANGDYIEVYNNISIESTAAEPRLIVQPQGAFVQVNNDGSVTGNARINKLTAPMNNWYEYTYWSSPISNAVVGTVLFQSNANRRFWFNAQNYRDSLRENNNDGNLVPGQDDVDDDGNDWTLANAADVMIPGRGYAATLSQIAFSFGGPFLFNFDGVMNNGIITVPVYRNDDEPNDNNWNFIGNPYPSAISADAFLTENASVLNDNAGALGGAIFLWSQNTDASATANGNENLNFSQSDYAIINGSGQTPGGDGVTPNRFIPSGQGFFVAMDNDATATNIGGDIFEANVVFNNSMRVIDNNDLFFRAPNVIQPDKIWLNLTSDNGVFNQMLVAYVDGATNADDGMYYDAPRNLSTGTFASLYTTIENSNKPFAIQGKDPNSLRPDEVIALGFTNSITVPTVFTISIAQLQGEFMSTNTIFLKDNLLNLTHDLTQSNYNFTADVGEFNQRFEIVFNRESLNIGDESLTPQGLSIIELPNGDVQFMVSQQHQIKEVTIVDLMGRVVYQLKGSHHTETYNLSQLSKAAYIAKVTLANGQTLHKKAIKRF